MGLLYLFCILYNNYRLCGYPPFHADNQSALFSLIKKGEYKFQSPYWDNVSDTAKDFLKHLLVVDHTKRFTAKDALLHPWLDISQSIGEQTQLKTAVSYLRRLNARKRLKAAIRAVITGIRFTRSVQFQQNELPIVSVNQSSSIMMKQLVASRIENQTSTVHVSTLNDGKK